MICTDGESTDGDLTEAMRPLQNLPVLVVIRLCTDEDKIVEYWNGIDEKLEVDIDVLDDIYSEAKEVPRPLPPPAFIASSQSHSFIHSFFSQPIKSRCMR